ncbi:MAG: DoxX family membrane protein [Candidatus Andeanibacterium colombiense]|uniref:DoxX family membrane protein n=1 Tax=Candidatus Andeanibacterium colombiense TaxID=3121345 RepID=A0AAJ6BMJ9_9SPHN|nr:MAG: DoxX family membrane protein [Sphingomonadaceae bacterium]
MTIASERVLGFALPTIRILLGAVCFVNGFNWFFKIITPYPSMSDFVHFLPPPDIVGALIENGILFHLVKAVELVAGVALLANRFVPLGLVVSMSVTVIVFIVDVFKPEFRLRAFLMGSGTLAMTLVMLIAYLDHYRPMLAVKAKPNPDPAKPRQADGGEFPTVVGGLLKPIFLPLAMLSMLVGLVQVGWLGVMVGQYIADPKPISALHPLQPRVEKPPK